MSSHAEGSSSAPQGRGAALLFVTGGLLLIALAAFLAVQPGGVLQNMAPLVWWCILGFLFVLGLLMLWGGSLLFSTVNSLNRSIRESTLAFTESAQSSFKGQGMSLQNFSDGTLDEPAPIGVAGLQPRPLDDADAELDARAQFTDSQLSADRGFKTSEPVSLADQVATTWSPTVAEPPPASTAYSHGSNFPRQDPTTPSQFGSLPTAPAAFVARPGGDPFEQSPVRSDAATDFWTPALRSIDLPRFAALIDRLFTQAGFVTQPQVLSSPGVTAIWLFSRSQPGSPVSLVLCEHRSADGVSAARLEELRDVMATHHIRRGQFATTATVSPTLQALATQQSINLLDIPHLLTTISKRKPTQQIELWDVAQHS